MKMGREKAVKTHELLAREKAVGHELPGADGDSLVVRHGWLVSRRFGFA